MNRRRSLFLSVSVAVILVAGPATAWACTLPEHAHHVEDTTEFSWALQQGHLVDNVEVIGTVEGSAQSRELNFLYYRNGREVRDVLLEVGPFGLRTYDLADAEDPELIGSLGNDALALPGDTSGNYHQGESTNVDHDRKLVFLSRDPRAYDSPQNAGTSGIYVIDINDPQNPELITFHEVPAGHTSTCVEDCDYMWTGGPLPDEDDPDDWEGRPIYVTDLRDAENPSTYPDPVDLGRNDGVTDYAHDVQVDNEGVAWVSGRGGVRGYNTSGYHWDPVEGHHRIASAHDPVPYAGGGIEVDDSAAFISLMHNAERPVDGPQGRQRSVERDASETRPGAKPPHAGGPPANQGSRYPKPWQLDPERRHVPSADDGADAGSTDYEPGELLYVTNEAFSPNCDTDGLLEVVSLEGSHEGEGWRSTADEPFRLDKVGSWGPAGKEGQGPSTSCSAHYFSMKDGVIAQGFYGQGTRFLDVSDPANIEQIGYWNPTDGNAWAAHFYGDVVYVADSRRGIDILRLEK